MMNGGVMSPDETEDQNALREVNEELGIPIEQIKLERIDTVRFESDTDNFFCNLYLMSHSGEDLKL